MAAGSLKGLRGKEQRRRFHFPEAFGSGGSQAHWRSWDLRRSPEPQLSLVTDQSVWWHQHVHGEVWSRQAESVGDRQASGSRHALPWPQGVSAQAFLRRNHSLNSPEGRLPTVPKLTSVSHSLSCQA